MPLELTWQVAKVVVGLVLAFGLFLAVTDWIARRWER